MSIHVGTSGWSYDHWEGVLYPHGLPVRERLGRYVARFGTAELNSSFYRWPADASFASWRRRLPPGFVLTEEETQRILDRLEARATDPFAAAGEVLARAGLFT